MSESEQRGGGMPRLLYAAAAALWLVSIFLPATAEGNGSTLSSHELADLLASGALSVAAPSWLGLAWYALPVGAALSLMALGLDGSRGARLRAGLASVASLAALSFVVAVAEMDAARMGLGAWLAVLGCMLAVAASWLELAHPRERRAGDVLR